MKTTDPDDDLAAPDGDGTMSVVAGDDGECIALLLSVNGEAERRFNV